MTTLVILCLTAIVCSTVVSRRIHRTYGWCRCGRRRRGILPLHHLPSRGLWLDAARETVYVTCINGAFVFVSGVDGIVFVFVVTLGAPIVGYFVARAVIHDRDKIRRAARALGRVVVDTSGRLVVTPTPTQGAA